jgi:hypothetical protein
MVYDENPSMKGSVMDQLIEEYNRLQTELLASQRTSLDIALRMQEIASKLLHSND